MKLSYEWLNEYIDLSQITPQELGEKMSRTGIEVDSVTVPGEGLKGLVVGLATEVVDHPDSDHLHVVTVEVGADEPLQNCLWCSKYRSRPKDYRGDSRCTHCRRS